MTELMRFKSHIAGHNANVTVHHDRIEWSRDVSATARTAKAVGTLGVSMLTSGKNRGTDVIPVKAISSLTTRKDGLRFTVVSVICSGNTIEFRVSHGSAPAIKELLTSLMLGTHPALQDGAPPPPPTYAAPPPPVTPAPAAPPPDVLGQLTQLGALRDAGVLTDDEFASQKAAILGTPTPTPIPTAPLPDPPGLGHLPPPPGAG